MIKLIRIAIFDIDGCLADDQWRQHLLPRHVNGNAKDGFTAHDEFDAYHNHSLQDGPLNSGKAVFSTVIESMTSELDFAESKIVFFTARPEKYRRITAQWLSHHMDFEWSAPLFSDSLYMRAEDDHDPSPVVKYKMLINVIAHYHAKGYDVEIVGAYDDREDVLAMYAANNLNAIYLGERGAFEYAAGTRAARRYNSPFADGSGTAKLVEQPPVEHNTEPSTSAAAPVRSPELAEIAGIFDQMSATLRSRAADYGYNAAKVAKVMQVLFPDGVKLDSEEDFEFWHLFELIIVKLTRFANSDLRHKDSIHDMAIYAGFIERLVEKHNIQKVQ